MKATPLGINDLKIYRRHYLTNCSRYNAKDYPELVGKAKPDTFYVKGTPKQEREFADLDTCECPIWARGYLKNWTENVNGKLKPRRDFASLGVNTWEAALDEVKILEATGRFPSAVPAEPLVKPVDKTAITVTYAVTRFLDSRDPEKNPEEAVAKDTLDHDTHLLKQRLIPYCEKNNIFYIREFEDRDVCRLFVSSWRQMRRNIGEHLDDSTRQITLQRFRTFLRFCIGNKWMSLSGADPEKGKGKRKSSTGKRKKKIRYGLELDEYDRLVNAPNAPGLTEQENRETSVATVLMRTSGLRISDTHKFNDSEIVRNDTGDGWNCVFIQQKTGGECTTPLDDGVKLALDALPGRMEDGKKYFFTCAYSALRERVMARAKRAQKEKPFAHGFKPHCLRHTFAIQHFNFGTAIGFVSKWLGHESEDVTKKHYWNWIKSTRLIAEKISRDANDKMKAATAALRAQVTTGDASNGL